MPSHDDMAKSSKNAERVEAMADAFNEACNRVAAFAGELSGGSTGFMSAITAEVAERAKVAHRCTILNSIDRHRREASAKESQTAISSNDDTTKGSPS